MDSVASRIMREFQIVSDELIERGLIIDMNPLSALETESHTTLTWSQGAHLSYLFGDYQRLPHYQAILDRRDFSLCMLDGAIIQIRYDISDQEIVRHGLSYFPCPFTFSDDERIEFSLSELPTLLGADELRSRLKLISPIRFDYDSDFSDERHAHSHVSFNKDTCRIPAYGPISLGHFIRFILRYFYETEFASLEEWGELRPQLFSRTLPHPPPHEFHVDTSSDY